MPGMDGFDTHRALAQLPHPPHTVIVTAAGRDDVQSELERAGLQLSLDVFPATARHGIRASEPVVFTHEALAPAAPVARPLLAG